MEARMEVFSSDSFPDDVNVTCGSLTAKLLVKDLYDGRSRCILHGEAVVTPCDFERRAGIKSRNWKKTMRFNGKPLIHFLEYYTNSRGKKCVRFVNRESKRRDEPLSLTLSKAKMPSGTVPSDAVNLSTIADLLPVSLRLQHMSPVTASVAVMTASLAVTTTSLIMVSTSASQSPLSDLLLSSPSLTAMSPSVTSSAFTVAWAPIFSRCSSVWSNTVPAITSTVMTASQSLSCASSVSVSSSTAESSGSCINLPMSTSCKSSASEGVKDTGQLVKSFDSQAKGSFSVTSSNDKLTSSTISIEFHKGELLNQEVDVYVSIACDSLDLRYGAKTPLLLKAYYGYVKKCGKIPVGKIAVIESGFLTSKWIFYAVGLKYDRKSSKQVMQKILLKCLKTCDRLKACSIAFPALCTGGLNFPHDIAADIAVNTLESYLEFNCTTTNIKTVKLMVYMEDTYRLYAKFHKLLSRISDDTTETQPANISKGTLFAKPLQRVPAPLKSSHSTATHIVVKSFMVGYLKAETTEGDFIEDDSDVMVNSKVKNGQSGVASATLHKCGPEVQNIYDDFVSQRCEERVCVKYSTGGVRCKHVIHTIVPKSQKWLLGKMIATCLTYAEKLQCSSVSFPVIDTGNVDHDLDYVTYSIRSSIFLFDLAQPLHVESISNVCLEKTVCQLFKDKFLEQVSETGSGVQGVTSGGHDVLLAPTLPLSMQISTADEMKVEKTTDQLKHSSDEQYTVYKLFDQFVPKLSCKDIDAITRMSKHRHVEISIETSNNLSYIQLRGVRDDVANLKFEILQVLSHAHSVESKKYIAKLFYDKVKWQWLDSDNKYKDYEVLTNYHIEQAYCYNRDMIFIHKEVGEFNFNKMEMLRYQSAYKIKRINVQDLIKYGECPAHWTKMAAEVRCCKVALKVTDEEYLNVKAKFESSMCSLHSSSPNKVHPSTLYSGSTKSYNLIVKIERIENNSLYTQYMAKKRTMDQLNSPGIENEMELFHGCPRDVTDKISHQGFNRSFAGKNGTKYGRGVYFAWDASYSAYDVFSAKDVNGYKYMFLAKVLTGDFTVGDPSYIQPPPKNPNGLDLFDSVVDNITRPLIFVIFGDSQAYPEYLITFT